LLTTISAQVSSILVQARLADSLRSKEEERKEYHKRMVEALRKLRSYEAGAGAASRCAPTLARTIKGSRRVSRFWPWPRLCSRTAYGNQRHPEEKARNPEREMERFRAAVERGIEQIGVEASNEWPISKRKGDLRRVRLILEDPAIIQQIEAQIRKENMSPNTPSGWSSSDTSNQSRKSTTTICANEPEMSKTRHRDFWRTFQVRLLSKLKFPKMPS
jgi:hypothetical protein